MDGEITAEDEKTITIGSELPVGRYRLDCMVKKGDRLCSDGFYFSVQPGITVEKFEIEIEDSRYPIRGAVWVGEYLWAYTKSNLVGEYGKICKYEYNEDNCQLEIVKSYAMEDIKSWGESMSWDGTDLWLAADETIYQIKTPDDPEPEGLEVVATFESPATLYGISWDENNEYLWVAFYDEIVKCRIEDDHLKIVETYSSESSIHDILWVNGFLFRVNRSFNPYIYLYSSSITNLYQYNIGKHIPEDAVFDAICWDGYNFWGFSVRTNAAYKISGIQVD